MSFGYFFWISLISIGCLLDFFWISFGCCLDGGCGLKVCWISFGFLKFLDSHKKHQELALLVFSVKKQQKVHM